MRAFLFSPGLWVVVDALAVYRLTRLVTTDTVMAWPRAWLSGALHRSPPKRRRTFFFLTCPWCTSIWLAAGVVALTRYVPREWCYVAAGLAFSGVAGYLAEH